MTNRSNNPNLSGQPGQPDESRRGFLATTAALAGAAILAGCKAGGSSAQPNTIATFEAPKAKPRLPVKDGEPIKMGVIGLGGPGGCAMGLNHVISFANFNKNGEEKVEIAAI
ncbi:MAG: hypothetical protein WC718_08320, partial [Phycisphaerales bacterium]